MPLGCVNEGIKMKLSESNSTFFNSIQDAANKALMLQANIKDLATMGNLVHELSKSNQFQMAPPA